MNLNTDEKICRYCHKSNGLIIHCKCSDKNKYIHEDCLILYLDQENPNTYSDKNSCERNTGTVRCCEFCKSMWTFGPVDLTGIDSA